MVKKLYYENCDLQNFTASVLSCEAVPGGYQVVLDQTAFYPEGGGQACDLGTLGEANVLSVQEVGEDPVHLCDRPLEVGSTVSGRIDWARRFDQMQQHTGEHILSGIVHEKHGWQNVGFHVGADTVTVDFDGMIPPEALEELELAVNRVVWADRELQIYTPSPEELAKLSYRTKRALPWPVRIVEIPGADRCACCAVHVRRTGQVGLVKILSTVKFHEGVRMEIVCGERALCYLSAVYEQNRQVCQAFSAKPLETGAAARSVNDRMEKEKFRAVAIQRRLFDAIASGYTGDCLHLEPDLQPGEVRELADSITRHCGGTAAVCSRREDGAWNLCILGEKAGALGKQLAAEFSGRGGGKPGTYQGSIQGEESQIRAYFKKWQSGL